MQFAAAASFQFTVRHDKDEDIVKRRVDFVFCWSELHGPGDYHTTRPLWPHGMTIAPRQYRRVCFTLHGSAPTNMKGRRTPGSGGI